MHQYVEIQCSGIDHGGLWKTTKWLVADIMRKTRSQYHAAIRSVRKNETEIVNNRLASAMIGNRDRDFWSEVKRIRHKSCVVSSMVDGKSDPVDVASVFADKFGNKKSVSIS